MNTPWPAITLTTANGAKATLFAHGAHITEWQSAQGKNWIFTSEAAIFAEGQAIRGGVPIVFPQFNHFGPGPKHGFLRNIIWSMHEPITHTGDSCTCTLRLKSSEQTLAYWPHAFIADFKITLTDTSLDMALTITNTGDEPFSFNGALHTYFSINELLQTKVSDFKQYSYWDNGTPFEQRQTYSGEDLSFDGALDRVYFGIEQPLTLHDGNHSLKISQSGFSDSVIWNPGAEDAKAMADLKDDEYSKMLCIEAAQIDQALTLNPGETWTGVQNLVELS